MASLSENTKQTKKELEEQRKQNIKNAIHSTHGEVKAFSMYEDGKPYTLNIDQIDLYDKNPRITKNPEYEAIYASLEADGFNKGALDVTQRPGDDPMRVFVKGGGNTTLSILKKLYEETGDNKYFTVTVIYRNWVSEYDCLASHHKENHLRGGQKYIEDALAILQMKEILEKETDTNLSDNEFIDRLKATSIPGINKVALSRMKFTVDRLWPICPELLKSGIGSGKVSDILKLEKHAATLHNEYFSHEGPEDWDKKFDKALKQAETNFQKTGLFRYQDLYYLVIDQLENDQIKRNRLDILLDGLINNKKNLALDPDLLTDDQRPPVSGTDQRGKKSQKNTQSPSAPPETKTGSIPQTNQDTKTEANFNQDNPPSSDDLTDSQDNQFTSPSQRPPMTLQEAALNKAKGIQYDSGLVAAKSTVSTEGIILHDSSAHQKRHEWSTLMTDYESSIFNDIPISCSDVREYAPLPNKINELRQIMLDKAYYLYAYTCDPGPEQLFEVHSIDSGAGFVLSNYPDIETLNRRNNLPYRKDFNPRTGQYHKLNIVWYLLLGFSDMVQLNLLRRFDIIDKYQTPGNLKDILMTPFEDYYSIFELDVAIGLRHCATPDIISLFIADASPKQLQLFIELQLTFNRLMKVANYDIWETTGRGIQQ